VWAQTMVSVEVWTETIHIIYCSGFWKEAFEKHTNWLTTSNGIFADQLLRLLAMETDGERGRLDHFVYITCLREFVHIWFCWL
jgi:hypothetical protein